MGEGKQKGFLTVTLIAVTDCHISSFTLNHLNTKIQIKFLTHTRLDIFIPGCLWVSCCFYGIMSGLKNQLSHTLELLYKVDK